MSEPAATPAFDEGTVFVCTDIIRSGDPTVFVSLVAQDPPTESREVYDRRDDKNDTSCPTTGTGDGTITIDAYLFNSTYSDMPAAVEFAVNPEFEADKAKEVATTYAKVIGLLPKAARTDLARVWIHKGNCAFGGADGHLVIHTDRGTDYIGRKDLAEAIVHELAHVSLDQRIGGGDGGQPPPDPKWLAAQTADGEYISNYAQDNPEREDVAESFLAWLSVRYREDRLGSAKANKVLGSILNRLAYFDGLQLDMSPIPSPRRGPPG